MVTPEEGGANGRGETAPSSSSAIRLSDVTPQQIMEHRENVLSDDPAKQLHSTQHFRRLLSIGEFGLCACFMACFNVQVVNSPQYMYQYSQLTNISLHFPAMTFPHLPAHPLAHYPIIPSLTHFPCSSLPLTTSLTTFTEKNPPIQQVIDSGVVHRFVQFLQIHENPVSFSEWVLYAFI